MNTKTQQSDVESVTSPTQDMAGVSIASNPDIKIIELDVPIQCGNRTITTLELRRPNSGALRGLSIADLAQINVTALQKLLPRITTPALTTAELSMLDVSDLTDIGVEVAGFLAKKKDREAFL